MNTCTCWVDVPGARGALGSAVWHLLREFNQNYTPCLVRYVHGCLDNILVDWNGPLNAMTAHLHPYLHLHLHLTQPLNIEELFTQTYTHHINFTCHN